MNEESTKSNPKAGKLDCECKTTETKLPSGEVKRDVTVNVIGEDLSIQIVGGDN